MMTVSKAHLAGIAAVLTCSLTGCGAAASDTTTTGSATPAASTTKKAAPRDALLDAIPDERTAAFRYEVKGGQTPTSGVLDAPKKALEIKIVQSEPGAGLTLTMTARTVGEQSWVKIAFKPANLPGLPKISKKWQLLDPGKTDKDIIGYDGSIDPGYTTDLVRASAGLAETSPGHFAGTTDLTKSTEAEILDEKALKALGAKASAVPFTAEVDAEGRLTTLTVKIPAAGKTKAQTYSVHYSGFGATPSPAAPAAGEQQKATADVYDLLRG